MKPPRDPELLDPTTPAWDAATEIGRVSPEVDPDAVVAPTSLRDPRAATTKADERYRAGALLGQGGMGEVRLVRDTWMGRDVALKVIREEAEGSTEMRARFLREIRVQGQLEHPGIVPVYDVGSTGSVGASPGNDGGVFFTMRRIRGETLADVVSRLASGDVETKQRFSRRKLLAAFTSVCNVVHYANSRGVVHRDLKPANVMLGDFGEVYVLDWGVAKVVGIDEPELSSVSDVSTGAGRVIGTLAYMAPEQARGDDVDARTDVYALGAILFELLALEPLMHLASVSDALRAIAAGLDGHPARRRPDAEISPELDAIAARATALTPADRFDSARDVSNAIERFLDGDRDLERRREIGSVYLAAAASRMRSPSTTPHDARLAALRDVLRAVALAPEERAPLERLAHLVLDPPPGMPPEAEAERAKQEDAMRTEGASMAWRGYLSFLLTVPLVVIAGIRAPWIVWPGFAIVLAAAVYARVLHRRRAASSSAFAGLALASAALVYIQSLWLGPFVLTPIAVTITTALFALYARRSERRWVFGAGALLALLPFALELVPGYPKSFGFRGGELVLFPRALDLPPVATTIGLVYTTLGYALLPAALFVRMRDAHRVIEDRAFLQGFTLRKLFPARAE